jgi:hypothetical protein
VPYHVGGGPWAALRTYFVQLFPPLPTTSISFDPSIAGAPTPGELAGAAWRGLAVAAAVALLSVWALRERAAVKATGSIVALGFALWLAPPLLLSVTPKYQAELNAGRGYLPVLIQVFGVAILLTCGLRALLRAAAARSRPALAATIAAAACVLGLAAGVTAFNNLRVLGILQPDREARALLEAGVQHGAFAAVPAGASVLFVDRDLAWSSGVNLYDIPWQALMLANRTDRSYDARIEPAAAPDARPCPRAPTFAQTPCAELADDVVWVSARERSDGGTVVVAPAGDARTIRGGVVDGELRAYRELIGSTTPQPPRLVGATSRGTPWTSSAVTWRRLRAGDGWALYAGRLAAGARPLASSVVDPRGQLDFTAMPAPPARVRLLGSRRLLP